MLHDNLIGEIDKISRLGKKLKSGRLPWQYYRLQMKVSNPMC